MNLVERILYRFGFVRRDPNTDALRGLIDDSDVTLYAITHQKATNHWRVRLYGGPHKRSESSSDINLMHAINKALWPWMED